MELRLLSTEAERSLFTAAMLESRRAKGGRFKEKPSFSP